MKVQYNIKKLAFIIIVDPFNMEARPYAVLKVYSYKEGFS